MNQICILSENFKQPCLENKKYHFDSLSLDFLKLLHNTWLYIISFCYVCYFYKIQETQSSIIQRNL